MDVTALFKLSYGMYVIASKDGERNVGCIANSALQVSASPATLMVSLNKDNYTTACIQETKSFTVSVLTENAPDGIIGNFGFSSGRDRDKFEGIDYTIAESGIAVLNAGSCAYIECKVIKQVECYSHIAFFAEITDARALSNDTPMTYGYYHKELKGKAPKNAPTFVEEAVGGTYKCDVCGYVFPGSREEFEALPDTYRCPVCKVPKSRFSLK